MKSANGAMDWTAPPGIAPAKSSLRRIRRSGAGAGWKRSGKGGWFRAAWVSLPYHTGAGCGGADFRVYVFPYYWQSVGFITLLGGMSSKEGVGAWG